MRKRDLHTHTWFSDGANSPEEMVLAAIDKGLEEYGISDHSYTPFDTSYCMTPDRYEEYVQTVRALQEVYKDTIRVLCGMEEDYYSDDIPKGLDYCIGSVHYLKLGDRYLSVDDGQELLVEAVEKEFRGDPYALCECYFETIAGFADRPEVSIIGHFDYISLYNEQKPWFDEHHERYVKAWQKAADRLIAAGKCFEINHGTQNKGRRTLPFLTPEMQQYVLSRGGSVLDSSDSHKTETIGTFSPNP